MRCRRIRRSPFVDCCVDVLKKIPRGVCTTSLTRGSNWTRLPVVRATRSSSCRRAIGTPVACDGRSRACRWYWSWQPRVLVWFLRSERGVAEQEAAPPAFSRIVRLTASAAREMAPAISPDGKWVAYLSDARGPTDVWVQFIVGGGPPINLTENANITVSTRSVVGGLEISKDGSRILFSGVAGVTSDAAAYSTYSVQAPLGGAPSIFLKSTHGVRWSPDGRRIAYVIAGSSAGDAIWIADGDGGNAQLLVRAEGNLHKHWPSWSVDGQVHLLQSLHDGVECRTDGGLSRRGDRWPAGTGRGEREPRCIRSRDSRRTRPDLRGRSRRGGAASLVATARRRRVCAPDNRGRRVRTTANLIEWTDDGLHVSGDA